MYVYRRESIRIKILIFILDFRLKIYIILMLIQYLFKNDNNK